MIPVALETTAGVFTAHFSELGLARLEFPPARRALPAARDAAKPRAGDLNRWTAQTRAAIEAILDGRPPRVLPPLDLAAGTDFQRRVWSALRGIARGRTQSYAEVAAVIGRPRAARAVGGACGANPVPLLVPCHRVLAANGRIGGFSGGRGWKERLLGSEGVRASR